MANNSAPPSRAKTRSPANQMAKAQPSAPLRLKTVVRRLPPNLPETVFWQTVEPWVSEESVSWKVFYQGKLRKKPNKENIPSRAYILFKNEESLASFGRGYDGHLFRDKQGNESQAVVEFAPNQKIPPEKKKVDSRHATIQQDEDYLSFVAALQNPPPKPVEVDVEALLAATVAPEEPKMTPLLVALREQKSSALEKKLAASETAKPHSRKTAATATVPGQKPEGEDVAQPAAKRSRKGKGSHHTNASHPSTAPSPASAPAKPGKSSGLTRNRSAAAAGTAPGPSTPVTPTAVTTSIAKEPLTPGADEASQRRNRPIIGLQSRHLKAALNGAGMAVPPSPSSFTSTSTSGGPSAPVSEPTARQASSSRGATGGGGGGGKQNEKDSKDGSSKSAGSGRGGKDRARVRHATANTGTTSRGIETTPRILSREDSATVVPNIGEVPARDGTAAGGLQEPGLGGGRGRNRRGRGQH